MLTHGNWWNTTLNLEPRLEKPPLPTWITAIMMYFFGQENLIALRIPSAISGLLLSLFLYRSIKELFSDSSIALLSALILQSSYLFILMSKISSWDIYTHAFMMGGIYYFIRLIKTNQAIYSIGLCLFLAFSIYSKGPVAPYSLYLSFIIALIFSKYKTQLIKNYKPILFASILGIAIGFSWYLSMYYFNESHAAKVIDKETVAWSSKHVRPFYFYLHFPIFSGIWCIPLLLFFIAKPIKALTNRLGDYKMILLWLIITLVFLSVVPTKKERYLLPLLIPMSIAASYSLKHLLQKVAQSKKDIFNTILSLNFYLVFILLFSIGIFLNYKYLSQLTLFNYALVIGLLLSCFIGIYQLTKKDTNSMFKTLIISIALFMISSYNFSVKFIDNYDDFVGLESLQSTEEFQSNAFYREPGHPDPRMVWFAGKHIEVLNWEDVNEWPDSFIFMSYWDMEAYFKKIGTDQYAVRTMGKFHTVRKKIDIQAHVYHIQKIALLD